MFKPLLPKHIPKYRGFTSASKLSGAAKAASIAYDNQLRRCYGKNNPRYKDNGAKGIEVLYPKEDFISWYLFEIKKYTGERPTVGRIDHNKSYSFDNIQIESLKDNSLERINRVGTTRPKIKVYIIIAATKEKVMICDSIKEAGRISGVCDGHIPKYCRNELKQSLKGYTFEYVE